MANNARSYARKIRALAVVPDERGGVMVALNFKPEFVIPIDAGVKRRTIRRVRKTGNPEPGKALQLFTGMRTSECEKIRDATCTRVRSVMIDYDGVRIDGRSLYAGDAPAYLGGEDPESFDGDFARADGFNSFTDMLDFFRAQYGLPFVGQLIEWRLGSPAVVATQLSAPGDAS
jgi:hypothetical protein